MRLGKNQKYILKKMKEGWVLKTDSVYGGGYEIQKKASDGRVLSENIGSGVFNSLLKKGLIKFQKSTMLRDVWVLTKEGTEVTK